MRGNSGRLDQFDSTSQRKLPTLPTKIICLASTAATCLAFASTAQANEAVPAAAQAQNPTSSNPDPDTGNKLQEIVVTAQKRNQSIQQVGITMQAITGAQLSNANIVDAAQLAGVVPGLNIAGANAGQTLLFGIRGVVQQDFVGSAESPVATYIDDGYIASNSISGVGLLDIDHIEVLKGPQGTLFGRNATGGVVNIFTKLPTDTWQGYTKLAGGSYGTARVEGAIGGPLSDVLKFRIAGVFDRNGAWVTNTSPTGGNLGAKHGFAIRGHLDYTPTSNFEALLTVYSSHELQSWGPYFSASTRQVLNAAGYLVDTVVVNQPTGLGTLPSDPQHLTLDANDAQSSGGSSFMTGGTLKLSWDIGPKLVAITDYKQTASHEFVDDDASPQSWLDSNNNEFATNYSEEIRIFQDKGHFRWYGGLYYLHIHSGEDPDRNTIYFGDAIVDDISSLKTNSYSAFGQVEYDFAPQLTAVGGFRATKEVKDYDYRSEAFSLADADLGPARTPYTGHMNQMLYSGKAQVEYRPDHDLMFYIGYNRGAKAGSFNTPFAGGTAYPDSAIPYKPETLHSFEAGEKATLFGGAARLNAAAFYYNYDNYQAFNFIGLSTQVTNDKAHIYGGEVEFDAKLTPHLKIDTSASYTNDQVYGVNVGGQVPLTRTAPYTSKWKSSAQARYDIDTGIGNFAVQAGADFTGTYFYSLTNFSSTRVAPHLIGRANIGWTDISGLWSVILDVQNIANKRYENVGFDISGLCGCSQVGYSRPRWFTATLGRKF